MGEAISDRLIRRLRSIGGVEIRREGKDELLISVMGGRPVRLTLDVRHRFPDASGDLLVPPENRQRRRWTVLAVPRMSPKRRQELRAAGRSWFEYMTGFAHMRAPGLAIDLPAETAPATSSPHLPNLTGKAGTIVEALIERRPEEEFVSQPEVAAVSGSTQAWTSRVFRGLVKAGALEVRGAGPNKVWRPDVGRLLDLWIEGGRPTPGMTGLYAWARSSDHLLERLRGLDPAEVRYAVSGLAAANLHEPALTSLPFVSIWIPFKVPATEVGRVLDAQTVDSGANIEVWQVAGDHALRLADHLERWRADCAEALRRVTVVSPSRAVVESMEAPGRGREMAERLRETILRRSGDTKNGSQ